MDSSIPNTQLLQEWVSFHLEYIRNHVITWAVIQRSYENYGLEGVATGLVSKFGIHEVLRYLQQTPILCDRVLLNRYCLLRAIQKAPLDKTNLELTVYCGDKEVVLTNVPQSDGESLQIKICIYCEGTPEDVDPNGRTNTLVNTQIKVEISDPLKGKETHVSKSTRCTRPGPLAPTQGIRNRNQTCYGICVLHTLVYLMQLQVWIAEGELYVKEAESSEVGRKG